MTLYTPEEISLARELWAGFKKWGEGSDFWNGLRAGLANGVFDNEPEMQAMLAAIRETTERAAKYTASRPCDDPRECIATALHQNHHLKDRPDAG